MSTFVFPLDCLKAAACVAPKDDVRYYLNGVLIERLNDTHVLFVATNGSAMIVVRAPCEPDTDLPARLIIPRDVILALKAGKNSHEVHMSVSGGGDEPYTGLMSVPNTPTSLKFAFIAGEFPDWRRVIPAKVSGDAGVYDPNLLALFAKAQAALALKQAPLVAQNGPQGAALVGLSADAFGLVMPYRGEPQLKPPQWFSEVTKPAKSKKK